MLNSKNILLENKISTEDKLKLKENELLDLETQFKNNLIEIDNIEKLVIDLDFSIDELRKSIAYNTDLKKKLVSDNEEV